jgi:signal transduction histidine kinase
MPEGGQLEVILEEDRKNGEVSASLAPANGLAGDKSAPSAWKSALLRISDEGPGIPDEIREKIFDLYFTTKSGGSGIGLAMTYRILQLHYGSVDVQSREGRGTEFRLHIPLTSAERGRRYLQPANIENEKGLGG